MKKRVFFLTVAAIIASAALYGQQSNMASLAKKIAAQISEISGLSHEPTAQTEHFISYDVQDEEVNGVLQIYRYEPSFAATDIALVAFTNPEFPAGCWLDCYEIDRKTGNVTKTELPFTLPGPSFFDDEAFGEDGGSYWRTEYTFSDNGDVRITAAPGMSWVCKFIVKWDKQSGFILLPRVGYDSITDLINDEVTDNAEMEKYVQNVIRPNFQRINNTKNWLYVEEIENFDLSLEGALITFYYSKSGLEKVVAELYGETGKRVIEYYLLHGRLSFIYDVVTRSDTKTERRWYLKNDSCFRIIGDNGKKLKRAQISEEDSGVYSVFLEIIEL